MKLYDYNEAFKNIIDLFEDDTIDKDILEKALADLHLGFEEKCENVARWNKALKLEAEAIKEEEARLAKRRRTLENRAESNIAYLEEMMKLTGKTKFKTPLFTFYISKNTPSLNIGEEAVIPEEYIKNVTSIDKRELLAAIKAGLEVEGVEIIQNESLKIR